ncbi:MAG: hypothetical protein DWB45_05150 [Xanthomonadales bacterium]|nr:hypothetical protein [Xanthomonadales bacterium]MDL1869115.1 hypothetical protein [Gammaproteobacteria bacterium PRO6]
MKTHVLAAALAAVLLTSVASAADTRRSDEARAPAVAQQQLWAAWGGTLEVRWNRDLAKDLGLTISAPGDALPGLSQRGRDRFAVRKNGGIEFHVVGGYFRGFDGGKLQASGGYTMRLPNGEVIDYTDFRLVPNGKDPLVLDFVGRDDQAWFYVDRMMYELLDHDSVLSVGTMDMRIAPALAKRIGHPEAADWPIADLAMTTDVQTQGSGAMPLAASPHWHGTPAPNGGTWQADLFMKVFSMSYTRCQDCSGNGGNGKVVFTPSSTLRNNVNAGTLETTIPGQGDLGTSTAQWAASVPWYAKFSGAHPPHGNDQHPFLIWNMYRINADGSIEQIGRSGVKHAWLTTNGGCMDAGDHDSHILGRGCSDTYSTGNNDTNSDLGPRSEIVPAAGIWGRCGSIYDPGCVGSLTASPNGNWDQRLIVRERQISATRNPGASYLFESWYIARDDINPYNSMATVIGTPSWTGSTWAPGSSGGYKLGPAIDRWVDPANPPANARNTELATSEGRVKVAVKVTDLGNSRWRYDYAVMNVDFARAVTSGSNPNIRVESNKGFDAFRVPVPAGARANVFPGRVGELDPGYFWRAGVADGVASWTTSTSAIGVGSGSSDPAAVPRTLDWGTMYSFSMIANRAPVEGSATLHVATAGSPAAYDVTTLVPGSSTLRLRK